MILTMFLTLALCLVSVVGVGAFITYKLYSLKQESCIKTSDMINGVALVGFLGALGIFGCSVALDITASGLGLSEVSFGHGSVASVVIDSLVNLPSDILVRSFGRTILCLVATIIVFFITLLLVRLISGKKEVVCDSKLTRILTDTQVSPPLLLGLSFIPALVALFVLTTDYYGHTSIVTETTLSESRVRHLKSHCDFGSAFFTSTTVVCDNKVLSMKRTGVSAFSEEKANVLVVWDIASNDADYKNHVIVRDKTGSESSIKLSDVTMLIDSHLFGY